MKKILPVILMLVLIFSLSACGNSNTQPEASTALSQSEGNASSGGEATEESGTAEPENTEYSATGRGAIS